MADVLFVWTCGLTQEHARLSRIIIWKLARERKPDAKLLIWGCLPRQDPSAIPKLENSVAFGHREVHILEELIGGSVRYGDVTANYAFPITPISGVELAYLQRSRVSDDKFSAFLDICHDQLCNSLHRRKAEPTYYIMASRGCTGHCTYCSDRVSCGVIQSKPIERVVTELRLGLQEGYKRFQLVSTDAGAYGRDLGYTLCDLLKEIEKIDGDYRLHVGAINPAYLRDMWSDLLPHFSTGKIVETCISGQCGSDRILKLMGRRHSATEFEEYVKNLQGSCPRVFIATQLMVGFPSETEEDFVATLGIVDRIDFDHVEVFKFSSRPTTLASRFKEQVSPGIAIRRYRQLVLKGMLSEIRAANKRRRIGLVHA